MKRKTQMVETRMRQVNKIVHAVSGFGTRPPQGMLRVFVPMIALIILICLAFPVSVQSESAEWALYVQTTESGSYLAGILWDNLRTYGPGGYTPSGEIVSIPISIGEADTWNVLAFNATTPKGTELTFDILPADGSDPIPGYADILRRTNLGRLDEKIIRLRANLSTSDSAVTPILHDWSITYTDAVRESPWSNVVSSSPKNQ